MPKYFTWIKGIARSARANARQEQYVEDGTNAEGTQVWLTFEQFRGGEQFAQGADALLARYEADMRRKLGHTAAMDTGTSFLNAFRREDGTCFVAYWVWKAANEFHGLKPYYFPTNAELSEQRISEAEFDQCLREQVAEPQQQLGVSVLEMRALSMRMGGEQKLNLLLAQMDSHLMSHLTGATGGAKRRGVVIE